MTIGKPQRRLHGRLWYNVTPMPPTPVSTKNQPILIVFLENGGHVAGVDLPPWAARLLDWSTEEYGKRRSGCRRAATIGRSWFWRTRRQRQRQLWQALLAADDAIVDVLLLVHGQPGYACGCADHWVGADFFDGLRRLRVAGQARFRLRAVYQMNCYGELLAEEWLSLGAQAVNGAVGVNWLPEPSLSVFSARLAWRPAFRRGRGAQLPRGQPGIGPGLARARWTDTPQDRIEWYAGVWG